MLVIRWFIAGFASPGRPRDCAGDAAALEGAVWHDLDRFGPFWTVFVFRFVFRVRISGHAVPGDW